MRTSHFYLILIKKLAKLVYRKLLRLEINDDYYSKCLRNNLGIPKISTNLTKGSIKIEIHVMFRLMIILVQHSYVVFINTQA